MFLQTKKEVMQQGKVTRAVALLLQHQRLFFGVAGVVVAVEGKVLGWSWSHLTDIEGVARAVVVD